MIAIGNLFNQLIGLYTMIVFASVIASWLVAFNVVDPRNPYIGGLLRGIYVVTEPVLRPIRRLLPSMGGIDFSPLILLFGLWFLRDLMNQYIFGPMMY